MGKKLNSNFYNDQYYKYVTVNKVDGDYILVGNVHTFDQFPQKIKPYVENYWSDMPGNYKILFKKKYLKDLRKITDWRIDLPRFTTVLKENPPYLYSGWRTGIRTKITPADLPEYYIHIFYYKKSGYVNCNGVVDAVYIPSRLTTDSLKDDFLIISYKKPLPRFDVKSFSSYMDIISDDKYVDYYFGSDIFMIAKGLETYSGLTEPLRQMNERIASFN